MALLLSFAFCLIAQGGANEIIVDSSGNGDYCTLQEAVNAANSGDVLRVRHGVYEGATVTKGLRILADPYAGNLTQVIDSTQLSSPLTIKNVPEGHFCVVSDFCGDLRGEFGSLDQLITIQDCEGPVFIAYTGALEIHAQHCRLVGIAGHSNGGRLVARDSEILISDCFFATKSGPPIVLERSNARASNLDGGPISQPGPSVRIQGGSRLDYDLESALSLWLVLMGIEPFEIIDGSETLHIDRTIVSDYQLLNGDALEISMVHQFPERTSVAILGFGFAAPPSRVGKDDLLLSASSFTILNGSTDVSRELTAWIELPPGLRPGRHYDRQPPAARLARPGAQLLGMPIVFQGASTVDGETRLSLPLLVVF